MRERTRFFSRVSEEKKRNLLERSLGRFVINTGILYSIAFPRDALLRIRPYTATSASRGKVNVYIHCTRSLVLGTSLAVLIVFVLFRIPSIFLARLYVSWFIVEKFLASLKHHIFFSRSRSLESRTCLFVFFLSLTLLYLSRVWMLALSIYFWLFNLHLQAPT